ncbi:MAG: outer membrane lipoprotein-sorting protein [Acidobacteria bacterium]|nr:outer membrane lipoprotein-sorting protein [Acidobacteriota bacterium]
MKSIRHIFTLAIAFALTSVSMTVAEQQRLYRLNDQQVKDLLSRIEKDMDAFRLRLIQALDRSPIDDSRAEDNIKQLVTEFQEATERLCDHFNRQQVGAFDVEELLRRGVSINSFMQRQQLTAWAENDWRKLRRDLDELACAYNVAWNWSHPCYTAIEPGTGGLYSRLTGTYQLEGSRGDNPRQVAEQATRTVPSVETIIARMAQARAKNEALFRPYVVTRDYTLFGKERQKIKSQVVADVTFVPPDFKKYAIQHSQGTGLGEKIVRRMLEGEAEITKDSSTDLSPDNYDFRFIGEEEVKGQRCYVLELLPRRKDKNLLRGSIWIDASTYLLRRTEGEPAKSPSWWLRDVRIAFVYGDVGGMWLQTASESTANVRILGRHTMVSRDVEYKISELVALESSAREVTRPVFIRSALSGDRSRSKSGLFGVANLR